MSNIVHLQHPLLQHKLTDLRREAASTGRFRAVARQIAEMLAYELCRELPTEPWRVQTPQGDTVGNKFSKPVLVVSILRAGILMQEAFLDIIPGSVAGHLGIYRDSFVKATVEYYNRLPNNISEHHTFLVDPILASGATAITAVNRLKDAGAKDLTFVCFLAAQPGLQNLAEVHPDIQIITIGVDATLDAQGMVLPGLGDVGERIYGVS